ncbi:MAG: thioredoxin family protein [Candidatus Riflebacteria bacterium]|nr:thioredoxin family protein [Candidatus Riflebacteria bacterium]
MITVTVIKSQKAECKNCHEAHRVVEEAIADFAGKAKLEVIFSNTPEAQPYGIISTPVVAIEKRIYSMGKPVIKDKVASWIKKEVGA